MRKDLRLDTPRSARTGLWPVLFVAVSLVLSGCASGLGPDTYQRSAVGSVRATDFGTVIGVRNVTIEGTRTGLGPATGAIAGGIAGSTLGGGKPEHALGALGGALVGGLLGAAIEEGVTRQRGVEYTIRRSDGQVVTIVQAEGGALIAPGQPVRIIYGADRARVVPDY